MAEVKHQPIFSCDRTSVRFAAAFLLTLLLHLPLIFLRNPDYGEALCRPSDHVRTVVALPAAGQLRNDSYLQNLFAWAEIADCSTDYPHNLKNGFLQFIPAPPPRVLPPFPPLSLSRLTAAPFSFSTPSLAAASLPSEQFILLHWPDFQPQPPLPTAVSWHSGVFWRNLLKGPLKNQPATDFKELTAIMKKNAPEKLTDTTLLEVIIQPSLGAPRVLVRRSCGIPDLDLLGTRIIRRELENAIRTSPELKKSRKRFSCRILADWRLGQPSVR